MTEPTSDIFISVVAPCYNEGSNIKKFYERLKNVLDQIGKPYQIVLVNDGSRDSTLEELLKLKNTDSSITVINLARNFGKEIALSAGLNHAVGQVVVPIDSDLQDPPELIPKLIEKWSEGYDVVYAVRESRAGETFLKKLTAHMFYRVMRKLTNVNIPADTGDFRLIDRKVNLQLSEIRERHRFMKGLFAWVGFRQIGIKYQRDSRYQGKSTFNYWKLFNLALEGITSFSYVPLRIASAAGAIVSIFSFVYGAYLTVRTMFLGIDVPGYSSTVVIILFLGGLQLLALGLIGEYIGRIYSEVKQRPLYIVRDIYD